MTDYQNELVMEHLDLVNWVIRTRISVPNRPLLTYDDFYAIGCEAICRAALKYQADSGEFAPFACRYIYNAIIDHCRAMNYRLQRSVDAGFEEGEVLFDLLAHEVKRASEPPKPVCNYGTWREDTFSVPEEELAMWAIISPNNMLSQPAQERYMDLFTRVFGITREQLTKGPLPDVKLEVQ